MERSYKTSKTKSLSSEVGVIMTTNMINEMIELCREKKKILIEILRLTEDQRFLIKEENMDGLGELLAKKDKLMQDIDLLDVNFMSLYKSIKSEENVDSIEKINVNKYSNIETLKGIVNELNIILNTISMVDNENTKMMKTHLENIKSGLKHVKEVKKAYKGYNYEAVESMMIDEKK